MNPASSGETGEEYLVNELKRELFEELNLSKGCFILDIKFMGFINDDSIPVGRSSWIMVYYLLIT